MAYTDSATLKRYLGIPTGTTTDDTLLGECGARAQAMIDAHCNRTFEAATDSTRHFDALRDVDGLTLHLDGDLCQITTVTNGDGATVAASDYVTSPRHSAPWYALHLKAGSGVVWTFDGDAEDAIAITGRWAYSVAAPVAIQQACVRLATWLYRQKDTNASAGNDAGQPRVTAEGTWIMPSAMPEDVKALLAPFRRIAT